MLGQVGIKVDVVDQSDTEMNRKIGSHDTDLHMRSTGYGTLDSLQAFKLLYRSGARNNVSAAGYSNPGVDELIDTLDTAGVTYARDALIEQIWRVVLDEIVYVPLFHVKWAWAMRDELDLPIHPYLYPIFRYAHLRTGEGEAEAPGAAAAAGADAKN